MAYPGQDFTTFGTDSRGLTTGPDLDWDWTPRGGAARPDEAARVCLEILLRKCLTPAGSMDDATWGEDLRRVQNAALRPQDLLALQARVRASWLAEEFVDDAQVTALLSGDGKLIIDARVALLDDQGDSTLYEFAFALSAAGVQVVLGAGQAAG